MHLTLRAGSRLRLATDSGNLLFDAYAFTRPLHRTIHKLGMRPIYLTTEDGRDTYVYLRRILALLMYKMECHLLNAAQCRAVNDKANGLGPLERRPLSELKNLPAGDKDGGAIYVSLRGKCHDQGP